MAFKLSYENMLFLVLWLVSMFIIYKLVSRYENLEEGFQSIINNFKRSRDKDKNKKSIFKADKKKQKNKVSFDDLITEAENIDPSRYTVDNIKNDFFTYLESFQKAKFKNITGTTDEALEKFGFFKDQFFNIFK